MIKPFQKIRTQLLTENKFSKYLIYAIGDIVLVVIGILIALQINNWNETRKTRANLNAKLESLINALEEDSRNLMHFEEDLMFKIYSLQYLLKLAGIPLASFKRISGSKITLLMLYPSLVKVTCDSSIE